MFESQPVFENEPLVPTNQSTGKFDVDAFLQSANTYQKRWLMGTAVLSTIAVAYAVFFLLKFPFNAMASTPGPIAQFGACQPASGPAWALTTVNFILLALPLILLADQVRSYLRPSTGVISFKPYFGRTTSKDDDVLSPQQYIQHIHDRSVNWLQTIVLGIAFTSCVGMLFSLLWKSDSLCTTSAWALTIPYFIGACAAVSLFVAVLATMVYKHKKAMMASFSPTSALDSYHPL